MSNSPYASPSYGREYVTTAALAEQSARVGFIQRTYLHLTAAVLGLIAIEFVLFNVFPDLVQSFAAWCATTRFAWFGVLGGFMVVGWIANAWAHSGQSRGIQYAGLILYTVAEAIILAPLLWYATRFEGAIMSAGIVTAAVFISLTGFVFLTKIDFSFLKTFLFIGVIAALALIAVSMFTGFQLGVWFSGAMVVLMSGYILYYTSNVLHHYRTDQHVAAALALFSAVATLFWYILQLFMSSE